MSALNRHGEKFLMIILSLGILLHLLPGCCHGKWTGSDTIKAASKITGIYSDLYFNEEGRDLLGWEFFIVNSKTGYYILYQESIGEPLSLELIPLEVNNDQIQFTVPETGSMPGTFSGHITLSGLSGKFSQGFEVDLKKKQSYWGNTAPILKETGMYSNMHNDGIKGVTGFEFFIVLHRGTYFILFQESNGIPDTPLIAPIEFKNTSFSFSIPGQDTEMRTFSGEISRGALSGKFAEEGEREIHLKRADSYWQ